MKKILLCLMLVFSLVFAQTCFAKDKEIKKPKQHKGFFFGNPDGWSDYIGSEDIQFSLIDKTAIGYSLYGGFIDIDHLSEAFRSTIYYQDKIYKEILKGEKEFKLEVNKNFSSFFLIEINYPDNWISLGNEAKEKLAKEISIDLASYVEYNWTVYHEMIGWDGYRSSFLKFDEFESAFSREDLYSDCLGSIIARIVLRRDEAVDFESASLAALKQYLNELGIQPREVVKNADEDLTVKQGWWNGKRWPFNKVYLRSFDIGLSGYITPVLVKGIDDNAKPKPLEVPKIPDTGGFKIRVFIVPKEKQGIAFLNTAKASGGESNKKRIEPAADFNSIMDEIVKSSLEKLKY